MTISKDKAKQLLKMNIYERDSYFRSMLKSIIDKEKKTKAKKKQAGPTMKELEQYQKQLTLSPTNSEVLMKNILNGLCLNYEFQKIMYPYICDFVIKKSDGTDRCVVEIDGSSHKDKGDYDKTRDKYIESFYGLKTYRYKNEEVSNSTEFKTSLLKIMGFNSRRNV